MSSFPVNSGAAEKVRSKGALVASHFICSFHIVKEGKKQANEKKCPSKN
jgi:hypothetical protein